MREIEEQLRAYGQATQERAMAQGPRLVPHESPARNRLAKYWPAVAAGVALVALVGALLWNDREEPTVATNSSVDQPARSQDSITKPEFDLRGFAAGE